MEETTKEIESEETNTEKEDVNNPPPVEAGA